MEISQQHYKKVLPAALVKQAEKLTVRECDELEKGHFQAYVDEKDSSFDVALVMNDEKEVVAHSCDCGSQTGFCKHKTALLIFLADGEKNSRAKIKRNSKVNPVEALLEAVDAEKLKAWVKEQLAKHKELEVAFVHAFSQQQQQYTPEGIRQLTVNAVKAVTGNKKKLATGDEKRIVALWAEVHEGVANQYYNQVTDATAFLNFYALLEACAQTEHGLRTAGNRFIAYIADVLRKSIAPIQSLQEEAAWDTAIGFYLQRINEMGGILMEYCLRLLVQLHMGANKERAERLVHQLVAQYAKARLDRTNGAYRIITLTLVRDSNLFPLYFDLFRPVARDDDYNSEVIGALIECGKLKLAERYCLEQMKDNYRQDYSLPYLEHLKHIYTREQDNVKLVRILKELVPRTFNFNDFLLVYEQLKGEEQKSWRTSVLKRSSHMYSDDNNVNQFAFRLMAYEQNYKKMIGYIKHDTPFSTIVEHAGNMLLADKPGFLRELFRLSDNEWSEEQEKDNVLFPEMLAIVKKHCSRQELQLYVRNFEKDNPYRRANEFVEYLKDELL
jgi:hypothetical protein